MMQINGERAATLIADAEIVWQNATAATVSAMMPFGETATEDRSGGDVTVETGGGSLPRFQMIAYTGGAMRVNGWDAPVVIDLAGLRWTAKSRPILKDHSPRMPVGHTTGIRVEGNALLIDGVISSTGLVAREIVESSRNGFPWQSSVGADAGGLEFAPEGEVISANGREFAGPVYVSRRASLGEVSFVALGADDETSARVAAAAARKETSMSDKVEHSDLGGTGSDETGKIAASIREAAAAESDRIAAIQKVCGGNASIAARAIRENWEPVRAELEVLRAERAEAIPAGIVRNSHEYDAKVIEAAVAQTGRLPNIEKHYDQKTLDAADGMKNLGLQELVLNAARANGYTGRSLKADTRGVLQAAFSTMSLPGIFSSITNKFLLAGFMGVDQTWRQIASVRSVSDFRTVTSYRLSGAFAFDEIGAAGEIKHGAVSEESYQNAARTYAKMFSVTREDLINDDLGALSALPARIGRGAALKMNAVFWTAFHNNANFFTAQKNNLVTTNNLNTGGIDALTAAEQKFFDQVDPDGFPLAISAQTLLVPTNLYTKAAVLMASAEVRNPSAKDTTANPHAGKFRVVTTPYLSSAAIPGSSASTWYLLANPGDMSMIEVCFLNGNETPIVESADADFNVLGVQMRGYFDFGCALQDHRAAVKNTA